MGDDKNKRKSDDLNDSNANLLSELRSVETENNLRKKLEEKIRSQNKSSAVKKSIAKPAIKSAVFVPDAPSTSSKIISSTVNVVQDDSRRRFSKNRSYTGYNYRNDRQFSPEPAPEKEIVSRPSPPKDMPEHIRWLHERWSKYDRNFFTNSTAKKAQNLPPSYAEDYQNIRSKTPRQINKRKFEEIEGKSSSYFQWRYGGASHEQIGEMLTFKEFLISYPTDIDDQERAVVLYNEYKVDYKKRAFQDFFNAHHDEEWFREKYHPIDKAHLQARRNAIVQRRLEIFMRLLIRGWMETHVEYTDSRHVRKLLDAACVLLEGGTETDLENLSDLDYILEEKREESYDVDRLTNADDETDEKNGDNDEDDDDGELLEDGEKEKIVEKKKKEETELELMQHARDYTLYVEKHTKSFEGVPQDISDLPDNLPGAKFETQYVGEGVFVSKIKRSRPETSLHKAAALCIRNLDSDIERSDLESACADAHGGFMRLHMTEVDGKNDWRRHCVASFWHNANLKKILFVLRGKKIHGKPLVVIEFRDFTKRIELIDGLSSDKSVVLRDIQLCKSLIEHLDRRYDLWTPDDDAATPKINPLLNNLDECLAFHLQELIKSGKINEAETMGVLTKEKSDKRVDRDENLTRILDRLILYLRIVHSVDYYGCKFYESEDDEPRRLGAIHLRGPASRSATPQNLATYIKRFEENLKNLLPSETRLADEHVELLGKKTLEEEKKKFADNNIISVSDGLSKCCVCYKRFTSRQFAQSHFYEKHDDKLDEVQFIVAAFNNYLADPNRPSHVELL